MTKAQLLNNEEIQKVQGEFDKEGIIFEPFLDAALRRSNLSNPEVILIEMIVNWLWKQLDKAIKKRQKDDHRNWIQKMFDKIFP